MLELKVPWPMSAISEIYNRTHNILELEDVLPNACLEQVLYRSSSFFFPDVRIMSVHCTFQGS